MKRLALIGALALAGCATLFQPADMIPAGPDSAVLRSVERVVERHDAYVGADSSVSSDDAEVFLAESAEALGLVSALSEVQMDVLSPSLRPVMDRHDAYVGADASLDQLERDIYIESTERLRSILGQAEAGRRQ